MPLPNLQGCFAVEASSILFVDWVLVMVYEAGEFLCMGRLVSNFDIWRKESVFLWCGRVSRAVSLRVLL